MRISIISLILALKQLEPQGAPSETARWGYSTLWGPQLYAPHFYKNKSNMQVCILINIRKKLSIKVLMSNRLRMVMLQTFFFFFLVFTSGARLTSAVMFFFHIMNFYCTRKLKKTPRFLVRIPSASFFRLIVLTVYHQEYCVDEYNFTIEHSRQLLPGNFALISCISF